MSNFSLKKWYLDIADDKGNVYIGYALNLKWQKIKLNGFQHLWYSGEKLKNRIGLAKIPFPKLSGDKITWDAKGVKAQWESGNKSIGGLLYKDESGLINWKCYQPKAKAQIKSSELSFNGLGYAECIEITIPIWKLPFKTLYWGRCHSKNHYLVWIKWEGITSNSYIWHNGKRSEDFIITKKQIKGKDFCLKFGKNYPLREGTIASTITDSLGIIMKLIPQKAFLAEEHKWYAQGTLESGPDKEPATIIYEKVLW